MIYLILKARTGLVAKKISITRKGKTFQQTVYVRAGEKTGEKKDIKKIDVKKIAKDRKRISSEMHGASGWDDIAQDMINDTDTYKELVKQVDEDSISDSDFINKKASKDKQKRQYIKQWLQDAINEEWLPDLFEDMASDKLVMKLTNSK